jgi:PAS domain S-box-containing protein
MPLGSASSLTPAQVATALLSGSLQSIIVLDREYRVQGFNEPADKNLTFLRGKGLELGVPFREFVGPDQLEVVIADLNRLALGEKVQETKQLTSMDGQVFTTRYRYSIIAGENGGIAGYILQYLDLTRQQAAVQKAEESSLLLDLIFRQNHNGLLVVNLKTGVFQANPEAGRIFGLSNAGLKKQVQLVGAGKKWKSGQPFSIPHILSLEPGLEPEVEISRKGDERVFARISRIDMVHPDGSRVVLLSLRDITSEKDIEKKRLETELSLKTFARNFPNGNITVVNRNLEVVFRDGVDFETDLDRRYVPEPGEPVRLQYGKNYADYLEESLQKAFSGLSEQFELRFNKDTYSITITPLPDPDGSIPRVMKIAQNISDQKNAQLDAHYRREYLRQIIDVDPNLIFVKNREGEIILANKAIAEFFGTSMTDFLENGTAYFKTYKWHSEENQDIDDQIFASLKTVTTEEAFFHHETRKMHLFRITRTPFVSQGNELSILGVGVDITDRVNAENELITQREYLRHILDADPSLIFVKDQAGRYILVNRAFAEFYRLQVEDLIGKTDADLPWSEDQKFQFESSDRAVLDSRLTYNFHEHSVNPVTGKENFFISTKKPLLDAEGNLNILGVVTDISEQKRQEEQLRKSEFLLQQIFNKVADALFIIGAGNLRIRDCNPKAVELFRFLRKEDLIGEPIHRIRPWKEPASRFWKSWLQETDDNNPVPEIQLQDSEGNAFWGSLAAARFAQDGTELILLRISDISPQKKSEEQILQTLHEKDILIQEIHHRVKNNMAVISSLLQLQTGYIKDPGLIDVFRDSQSRIKSMALIHEKLYQSKTLAKVEMESYIQELTRTLFYTYNSRHIDLRIDTRVDNVFLDINSAVPCGLIINEVISNACKHAFTGRDRGCIRIRFEKTGEQYNLEISDDGVGMPDGTDISSFKSLGMNLIEALSAQLGAHLEIKTRGGVSIRVTFVEKVKPTRDAIRHPG